MIIRNVRAMFDWLKEAEERGSLSRDSYLRCVDLMNKKDFLTLNNRLRMTVSKDIKINSTYDEFISAKVPDLHISSGGSTWQSLLG